MATEFPVEYLAALDKVIELGSFTTKYQAQGAEFSNAKTVLIPEIEFDGGTEQYNRFKSEGKVEMHYRPYELDRDREKTFYIDAVEDIDEAHVRTTNAVSEFERLYLIPELDSYFFGNVGTKAKTLGTTVLTPENIKGELRKARWQMVNHGFGSADLYMTADALSCLEDAIDRQFAGEGEITDMVGRYNIFNIYMVPDERMSGLDFAVIAPGTIQNVIKRAVAYLFQPGQHTSGDGWLAQMRWVYGNLARYNKLWGLYANRASGTGGSVEVTAAAPEAGATGLGSVDFADLGTFDISNSGTTITVTGTVEHIEDWPEFSSIPADLTGYYIPLVLSGTDGAYLGKTTQSGTWKVIDMADCDEDSGGLIVAVKKEQKTFSFEAFASKSDAEARKNGTKYIVNLSGVTYAA